MHTLSNRFITAIVLVQMYCLQVIAAECPSLTLPEKLFPDDQACLDILDTRFLSYSLDIDFLSDRNALLSDHAYADQQLVIDTFYAKYCELLGEPRWKLSTEDQQKKLDIAKQKLYTRVPFPPPVVDTRNVVFLEPLRKTYMVSNSNIHGFLPIFSNLSADTHLVLAANQSDEPETAPNYLRDVPFLITRGNKYFVIVSSVSSREGALREVSRLKSKAPQFDFVAYAPYQGNPYYGVMMATWVPLSVAKDALGNAQKYVSSDSYIWMCPSEGDRC